MEVHFTPETEKKLKDLAAQSGHGTADELVQDVVEGYFDELAQTRDMLDGRYDDLKSGKVKSIPGEEVEAHFRGKRADARRSQPGS
jgi:hypothetical protein